MPSECLPSVCVYVCVSVFGVCVCLACGPVVCVFEWCALCVLSVCAVSVWFVFGACVCGAQIVFV